MPAVLIDPHTRPTPSVASRRFYRPELDLLRFVAFLMVFLCHGVPSDGGPFRIYPHLVTLINSFQSGLQLFFLLSAYLIAELLLREREQTGAIHLRAFYVRRALRIWPLYFLTLVTFVLLGRWTHFTLPAFLAYALLVGNWFTYTHGFTAGVGALSALWSISVEEQFYLLWPTFARVGGKRLLYGASILFLATGYLTLYLLGQRHAPFVKPWTHSLVGFQFFAFGTLLALLLHRRSFSLPPWARLLTLVVAVRALCWFADLKVHNTGPGLVLAFAALGLGCVCLFLTIYGLHLPRWCAPLLYLGRISYGLYVFHRPCLALLEWLETRLAVNLSLPSFLVLSLGLTVAGAALSHRFVERPFLRLKERFALVKTRST